MWPSIPVSLEPGLERGVHCGRDLYTFVTSAAGHMMRTLQKPRRNRPSKRQVNHRRFLHNMIQRKFADIEAANHRLASALYVKESEEKDKTSLSSSHKPDTPDQPSESGHLKDPDKCSIHSHTDSKSRSDVSADLRESGEKKQPDSGHVWKRHPKSQSSGTNNQSKRRQRKESTLVEVTSISTTKDLHFHHGAELFCTEYYNDEHQFNLINNLSEDTQTPLNDSFIQFDPSVDTSPSFSPELSPLSLDSCDFSIQMFTELSACTPAQRGIADITEGQLTDILDLISVGNKDSEGCVDVDAYLESIYGCQGDAGQEVGADATSDSFAEVEDLHCDGGEYMYEYGYGCHGDQEQTTNYFLNHQRSAQRQNVYTAQEQSHSMDITQNQPPTSISCHFDTTQLQTYQQESHCMQFTCENHLQFTPFEGVAQSFSAPLHNPENRPVPTPPQDEDWLFTDILKDRKSPNDQDNKALIYFNC